MQERLEDFFKLARERYQIYLRRQNGDPRPWTTDDILRQFKFCNIFREDDATTIWIRENVREPLRSDPFVMPAMMICRWFNRISTLEHLVPMLMDRRWDVEEAREILRNVSPLVTAAYLVRSPKGMNKLDGLLWSIDQSVQPALQYARRMLESEREYTLEETTEFLSKFPSMGDFLAYEVVSDLVHTDLLCGAPDIMTWANPGPGAARGLARMNHGNAGVSIPRGEMINQMRTILTESQDSSNWPEDWPPWTMREVEHTLCEFDKYERTRNGEGTPKQRYDGGGQTTIRYGQFARPSSNRASKPRDQIEELVNKKIEQDMNSIQEDTRVLIRDLVEDFRAKNSLLEKIPEEWLPLTTEIELDYPGWSGTIPLGSPTRLPAFVLERGLPVPEDMHDRTGSILGAVQELDEKRSRLYEQIKELIS